MPYTIAIDETQRKLILAALEAFDFSAVEGEHPESGILLSEEGKILTEIFADLPKDEAATPGVLHRFCF